MSQENLSDTAPTHGFVMPKDKYDLAIDYLMENPEDIHDAWSNPSEWEGKEANSLGS